MRYECKTCCYAVTALGFGNPWPKIEKHERETGHVMDEVVDND